MTRYLRLAAISLFAALLAFGSVPASHAAAEGSSTAGFPAPQDKSYSGTIRLSVDASDLVHRVMQVHEIVPVSIEGSMIFLYPEWLPGMHGPRGPIIDIAGLTVSAGGKPLNWWRDPVNVFAFHVNVPAGVHSLDVAFQFLSPTDSDQGRIVMSSDIVNVEWNAVALYPAGYVTHRIQIEPSLKLPYDWPLGTALEESSKSGNVTTFKPVPFDVLVDSPVVAARWSRKIDLDPGGRSRVTLDLFADRANLLDMTTAQIDAHRSLVQQADRLFGARHYNHYDFLVTMSERIGTIGLEHNRSSEDSTRAGYLKDWDKLIATHDLLAHEYTHSWNGKFRRPADLLTTDFNVPMRGSLLWVYEGQTQYWGFVLAARSGLLSKENALDAIANVAATYSAREGRNWRPVSDTTMDPIIAARKPIPWLSWQRSEDYYSEGQLVWLDVDTLIRQMSGNTHSLDDFARAFFGQQDGSYDPSPYTFDDVVKTLNAVQPYEWNSFLHKRLYEIAPQAPLDGLKRGGYRLTFVDKPTAFWKSNEARRGISDFTFSIGIVLDKDGKLTAVQWHGPAYKAGLNVGTKVLAVNGESYDAEVLSDAIADAHARTAPIELIVKTGDQYRTVHVSYSGGLRYPHLERDGSEPALLDAILSPRKP